MSHGHAERSATIPARPETVYAILADYRHAHPRILPKPYFTSLTVEHGGMGAGTVIQIVMRVLGQERAMRQIVSEPEPGRVLVEQDADADLTTTFTVTPVGDWQQAHVTIATDWTARPGVGGWVEKTLTTALLRSIYAKELALLASYAPQHAPA